MDPQVAERVRRAIRRFAEAGLGDVTRLEVPARELRLRVGDWRVRFDLDHESRELVILRVLPRGRAFRD